jgi:hypothetical protein
MRRFWPWGGAIGLVLLLGLGVLAEERVGALRPTGSYRVMWTGLCRGRLRAAAQLLNQPLKSSSVESEDYLILVYDRQGNLKSWNTYRWPLISPTLGSLSPEIYADEDKAYYLLKQRVDTLTVIVATPLWIEV